MIGLLGNDRCETRADIWEPQADGSLWQRGNLATHDERLEDGSRWLVVDAVPVGGYGAHYWLRLDESNRQRLRVWTHYESRDSSPDAVEDHWYGREPRRLTSETLKPLLDLTLER